ncbi:MAG: GIY-YIG nuclease family protein [Roseovarius sp.]
MNIKGRSLQLFFVDGRPDGMLTAEVFNWTGHVLRFPRTQLKQALNRTQAEHTGVYVLIGEQDGRPLAYIGEAEDLSSRIKSHAANKDWWETAVLITSAADNLHKAHAKYLESRLVEIADSIKAISLENGNVPPRSSLSEADLANMEFFLDTLRMVLPAIRVDMFLDKSRPQTGQDVESQTGSALATFVLTTPKHGVSGEADLIDGEWIIKAGSKAKLEWSMHSSGRSYEKLHSELILNGTLVSDGKHAVFVQDYAFTSPSAAAAIMNGRASNGRRAWKEKSTGLRYGLWEAQQLEAVT